MVAAILDRPLGSDDSAADLFCGFGGSSQGLKRAGLNIRLAANHDPVSIDCHAANHPDTEHVRADLSNPDAADYRDPENLPPVAFLWASPSCKHHSKANSKKVLARGPASLFDDGEPFDQEAFAASERSRVTMLCPLRYAKKHRPLFVVVENVLEVTNWGPQQPGKKVGDGTTFKWWLHEWEKAGYDYRILYLNSMFFAPCPQSRDRVYIVLWQKGMRAPDLDYQPPAMCTSDRCQGKMVNAVQVFKRPTAAWLGFTEWGKYGAQYFYRCPECAERVEPVAWPAYTAINWANLGPTIAEKIEREGKELAPATMERIRRGVTKMRGGPALIIPAKATWGVDRPVDQPLTTQTTEQEKALVQASIDAMRAGNQPGAPTDPTSTVVGRSDQTLTVEAGQFIERTNHPARGVDDQLPTHVAGTIASGIIVDTSHTHSPARYAGNRVHGIDDQVPTVVAQPGLGLAFTTNEYGGVSEAGYRSKAITEPIGALTGTHSHRLVTDGIPEGTVPEGIIVPINGNDHERPGQTRARSVHDPMFTVVASQDWGVAHTEGLPFTVDYRGGGSVESGQRPVDGPISTVTSGGNHHGLAVPAIQAQNDGTQPRSVVHQFPTVVAGGTTALYVVPWLDQYRSDPVAVTEAMATVMTHARHALATATPEDFGPVTDEELLTVRFRMLEPDPELRLAMAFEPDYVLLGNKTQKVAGLGNAVTPPVPEWIIGRCAASIDEPRAA